MKRGKYSRNIIAIASLASLTCVMIPPKAKSSYVVQGETTAYSIENTVETEEPVCYITTNSKTTFYTSIEGALAVAAADSGSQTVYVIPGDATTTTTIYKDCTIASGDSLVLPYSATLDESTNTYSDETYSNGTTGPSGSNLSGTLSNFADYSTTYINSYRKSSVFIDNNVTLTVNGSLKVGGITGYSTSGMQDHTSGDYCEIVMGNNSKIVAESGATLEIYGYIKEATYLQDSSSKWNVTGSLNNNSFVEMKDGSTITLPLVIYDYNGGTNSSALYSSNNLFPFKLFDFPNVQSLLKVNYGATMNATYKIVYKLLSTSTVSSSSTVIAKSGGLVSLASGSYVTLKYTPHAAGLTQNTQVSNDKATTIVATYGDVELDYISVNFGSVSASTEKIELPISYRLTFEVHSGTLTVAYKVKFMPGTTTTICEGGTVKINSSVIVYDENYYDSYGTSTKYHYPKTGTAGKFINNGTMTIGSNGSFGGMVETERADAVFNAESASSLSVTSKFDTYASSGTITTASMTLAAKGYIGSNDNINNFDKNIYSSRGTYWGVQDKYMITFKMLDHDYTIPDTIQFTAGDTTVSYDSDSGTFDASIAVDGTDTISLSDVTGVKSFKDADGNEIASLSNITDDTVVYIEPKAAYTVTLDLTDNTSLTYLAFNYTIDDTTTNYVIDNYSSNSGISKGTLTTLALLEGSTLSFENVRGVDHFTDADGNTITSLTNITEDMTIKVVPVTNTVTLTIKYTYNDGSAASFSVNVTYGSTTTALGTCSMSADGTLCYYYVSGEQWSISYTDNVESMTYGDSNTSYTSGTLVTITADTTVTITGTSSSGGGGCILPGTLVNMADGTYKKVEDVKVGDQVLVFDHMTGKIGTSPVAIKVNEESKTDVLVMSLAFSNGKTVNVVYEHGFFDVDLNKYIYVNEETYNDYIGHRFYALEGNGSVKPVIVTLDSVETFFTTGRLYELVSNHTVNTFNEDILSIPGVAIGIFNYFDLDENMLVIPERMQEDIEKYGLFTYEEWAPYITEEEFDALNVRYLKISIGKGNTTLETLIAQAAVYLSYGRKK